jgi:hypothetical protein
MERIMLILLRQWIAGRFIVIIVGDYPVNINNPVLGDNTGHNPVIGDYPVLVITK